MGHNGIWNPSHAIRGRRAACDRWQALRGRGAMYPVESGQGSRERCPFCQRCFGLRRERDTGSSQNGPPGIIFSWHSRYWTCIQSVPLILARPSLVEAGCCSILNESPTARTAFIPPTCAFEFPRATAAVSIALRWSEARCSTWNNHSSGRRLPSAKRWIRRERIRDWANFGFRDLPSVGNRNTGLALDRRCTRWRSPSLVAARCSTASKAQEAQSSFHSANALP